MTRVGEMILNLVSLRVLLDGVIDGDREISLASHLEDSLTLGDKNCIRGLRFYVGTIAF